jgi:hypothetical protein
VSRERQRDGQEERHTMQDDMYKHGSQSMKGEKERNAVKVAGCFMRE